MFFWLLSHVLSAYMRKYQLLDFFSFLLESIFQKQLRMLHYAWPNSHVCIMSVYSICTYRNYFKSVLSVMWFPLEESLTMMHLHRIWAVTKDIMKISAGCAMLLIIIKQYFLEICNFSSKSNSQILYIRMYWGTDMLIFCWMYFMLT